MATNQSRTAEVMKNINLYLKQNFHVWDESYPGCWVFYTLHDKNERI